MISIIVCSINPDLYQSLERQIGESIGEVIFEIIRIDNSTNSYTIAEAYNMGITRAEYPFLVFVHEDVYLHTLNWGGILLKIFRESVKIGLLGIAGTRIKTKTPSAWWENTRENLVMNLIQQFPDGNREKILFGFQNEENAEVVCIDGVFIAMRKDLNILFDERLSGFHNYDQAISLRFREKGYKVVVNKEILIEHFSAGNKNQNWLQSNFDFYELYKHHLPQSIRSKRIKREEIAYSYYRLMLNYKGTGKRAKVLFYFIKAVYYHPFNKTYYRQFYKMLKDIL